MILHAENASAIEPQAAIRAIEERDVRFLHTSRKRVTIDSEAMIHGDDFDLPGFEILHRMVGAVMALRHFPRPPSEREAQHLMSEANAEHRNVGVDEALDRRDRIFAR